MVNPNTTLGSCGTTAEAGHARPLMPNPSNKLGRPDADVVTVSGALALLCDELDRLDARRAGLISGLQLVLGDASGLSIEDVPNASCDLSGALLGLVVRLRGANAELEVTIDRIQL